MRSALPRLGGYPYGGYTGTGAGSGSGSKVGTTGTNTGASKVGTAGKKDDKKATGKDLKNRGAKKKCGCC